MQDTARRKRLRGEDDARSATAILRGAVERELATSGQGAAEDAAARAAGRLSARELRERMRLLGVCNDLLDACNDRAELVQLFYRTCGAMADVVRRQREREREREGGLGRCRWRRLRRCGAVAARPRRRPRLRAESDSAAQSPRAWSAAPPARRRHVRVAAAPEAQPPLPRRLSARPPDRPPRPRTHANALSQKRSPSAALRT